jgi:hypothetical protein
VTGLVVPAYFHPAVAGAHWAALTTGPPLRALVLNSADGPGVIPDPRLVRAAVATGAPIYGYVDTAYATLPPAVVLRDVARWHEHCPVTGIFLDRVTTDAAHLRHYELLTRLTGTRVVLNHGAYPYPGYAEIAEAVVTFEGPYAAHRLVEAPPWALALPAGKFWHLVYATPPALFDAAVRHAAAANAGGLLVTDRSGANPWDGLPSYYSSLARCWPAVPPPHRRPPPPDGSPRRE